MNIRKLTKSLIFFLILPFMQLFLSLIPKGKAVKVIPKEMLNSFYLFLKDGYDELLFRNLQIDDSSTVLIAGGYKGDSALCYLKNYNCNIIILEPVTEYFAHLNNIFELNPKVTLMKFAVGASEARKKLYLSEDSTSEFLKTEKYEIVEQIDIYKLMNSLNTKINLFEINVEGGEYEILNRLIETNSINRINTFLIQFHNRGINDELLRAQIRKTLNLSHSLYFSYDWVWERWDKIEVQ